MSESSSAEITTILLLDVDGVLVQPLAYRLGVARTLEVLFTHLRVDNWKSLLPLESEIAYMESLGIHDVWDITNIVFALILVDTARQCSMAGRAPAPRETTPSTESLLDVLGGIGSLFTTLSVERPDYAKFALEISRLPFSHPPDAARFVLLERLQRLLPIGQAVDWSHLIDEFLIGTRTPSKSFGTRLFQNIILGHDVFERTYQLPSSIEGPGLLATADVPLLSSRSAQALMALSELPNWRVGIYTARPSGPPPDLGLLPGFSPEAEMALELCGIHPESLPLVGMGMMEWLAEQHNERPEDLTKPNTTQALSALIAAIKGASSASVLNEAYLFDKQRKHGSLVDPSFSLSNSTIYVFEDTISGIKPLIDVVEALDCQAGARSSIVPLGIATDPAKREALALYCGENVFDDVNQALMFVLKRNSDTLKTALPSRLIENAWSASSANGGDS